MLVVFSVASAMGQTQSNFCPQLKNPTAFTITGPNPQNASWYGYTGSKPGQASTCTNWAGSVSNTAIPAAQLSTQSSGSSCTSSASTDIQGQQDYQKRFVIKGTGTDPVTGNHLSYVPDNSFTSSIRLGNYCGGGEAEMLCYEFTVGYQNALVTLWYALSLQNGQHDAANNPEFYIRVEKRNGNNWIPVGGDTLCFIKPTPAGSSSDVSPFYVGTSGQHTGATYGCNIYLPWNKVTISLNNYLFETVRIKIGAGDCSYSAHYACAFIAGECQPMEIRTSGCPAGATSSVQTLTAPAGMENYEWARSNIDGDSISYPLTSPLMRTVPFTVRRTGTNSSYNCVVDDFRIGTGANSYLTSNMVFRCKMTSHMNPSIPNYSNVYVRVINTKPIMAIDTVKNCEGQVKITNMSYVPGLECDTSHTKIWVFPGADTTETPTEFSGTGKIRYTFDTIGPHAVRVRSFYFNSQAESGHEYDCYTDSTYFIHALGRPNPVLDIEPHDLCVGDVSTLQDNTPGSVRRNWIIEGDTNTDGPQTLNRGFDNAVNPVGMQVFNGLSCPDSVNPNITNYCYSTIYDTIRVFLDPEIEHSGDSIICRGEYTNVKVTTDPKDSCQYIWYYSKDATGTAIPGHFHTDVLHVQPTGDTTKYYVLVTSYKGCTAWDSVTAILVNPKLVISVSDICAGDSAKLTASAAERFKWSSTPADASLLSQLDSAGYGPISMWVSPKETTTYNMQGEGSNGCLATPQSQTLTIHPLPVPDFDCQPYFIDSDNPVVTFTDKSQYGVNRYWFFGDSDNPVEGTPYTHNFGEVSGDSVNVRLISFNDLGCSRDTSKLLPVVLFTFYAPNAFTPNRPDNNTFSIYTLNTLEHFSIFIYDRAGRQVFDSTDPHFAWDGTMDGTICPQGAYVYIIRYRRPGTEDIVTKKGTLTLIR